MLSGESKKIDTNLKSWTIKSIEPSKIEVLLDFANPLEVSQGDIPDKLIILIGMS